MTPTSKSPNGKEPPKPRKPPADESKTDHIKSIAAGWLNSRELQPPT